MAGAQAADAVAQPATSKGKNINKLAAKGPSAPATHKQLVLDIGVQIQKDVNGIEMGVLENGIP